MAGVPHTVCRVGTRVRGFVVTVLVLLGVAVAPGAVGSATGAQCVGTPWLLYAVRSDTGHLSEIDYCDGGGFQPEREVSSADWRQYSQIVPSGDGVYALTRDGVLLWHGQDRPDDPLAAPVSVGLSADWSRYALLAVGNGYLVGVSDRTEVFRPGGAGGWVGAQPPTSTLAQNHFPLIHVRDGSFAEAVNRGWHLRVWGVGASTRLYSSGALPPEVFSVTGGEPALFGIGPDRSLVRLAQAIRYVRDSSGNLIICPVAEPADWQITSTFPGNYQAVFAAPNGMPLRTPTLGQKPAQNFACGVDPVPVEWQ